MREEAAACDEVFGGVQFKEEKLSRLERTKLATSARLPEIDLVDIGELPQKAIPVVIRDANVNLHLNTASKSRMSPFPLLDPHRRSVLLNFLP